jgi:hypothetical protein
VDRTDWNGKTQLRFELLRPDETLAAALAVTPASPPGATLRAMTGAEGFHTLRVVASDLPAANLEPPYKLSVRYTAPKDFESARPMAADPAKVGQWAAPFPLKNVAIHAHLLPTAKILYWGRRKEFGSVQFATLNDHACQTYILDPDTGQSRETANQPVLKDGSTVNLFPDYV